MFQYTCLCGGHKIIHSGDDTQHTQLLITQTDIIMPHHLSPQNCLLFVKIPHPNDRSVEKRPSSPNYKEICTQNTL